MLETLPIRFFTVSQVAEMTQLTEHRVYEAVRLQLLPAVRIGRQVRIEETAFLDWVKAGGMTYSGGWRRSGN